MHCRDTPLGLAGNPAALRAFAGSPLLLAGVGALVRALLILWLTFGAGYLAPAGATEPHAQSAAAAAAGQAAENAAPEDALANSLFTISTPDPVTADVHVSRASCRGSSRRCVLLKVDYTALAVAARLRPPLNIALVLDNSGSMGTARKLPYTLEAARLVIENLTDTDLLALVAFNDQAVVLSGSGRVVNKAFLLHRLGEVEPERYTNLSAGLLEGIAQVSAHGAEGQVRQVLLLTDGQANRGETSPVALNNIVDQARRQGVGVSTFGVGSEFNEQLLSDLATASGGRYAYIGAPEQIPAAFEAELRGLLDVVAQNVVLDVGIDGGEITRVYGQIANGSSTSHRLVLGDVRAGDRGFLLAEVATARSKDMRAMQADVRLEFDDPKAGTRVRRAVGVRIPASGAPEEPGLVLLASILDAVEGADLAAQGLDTQRYRTARNTFERRYDEARNFAVHTRDQELLNQTFVLKHFMDELALAEKSGLLHGHREAQARLQKESHYLQYLLTHHRPQH